MTDPDELARLALMRLAAPGDELIGRLIHKLSAAGVIEAINGDALADLHAASEIDDADVLARQLPGWQLRLRRADPAADLETGYASKARFLTPDSAEWPAGLNELGPAQPVGLWVRGPADLRIACQRAVTITGSRAATPYGSHTATQLATGVARASHAIVAELADGIGAAALGESALCVAVLASGIDLLSSRGHPYRYLAHFLAEEGLVVSECPPRTNATPFRRRAAHRITAALGRATVIVEAAEGSGTLATAEHAQMLRRPLGAVPGPVTSELSEPCHRLIREGSAALVSNTQHVLALMASASDAAAARRTGTQPQHDERQWTPQEFVQALADGGMPFAQDDPAYCPAHGWQCDEGCRST
ncbi:hypothetical protein GCM10010156_49830 [Planobispora rosea]|uniref:Smf/DprA SLOG domain-containing protein n=1 Tax=Planobispora rosea TaxID=35762 RepID=A0A8J3WE08_PLARO|nr:DNA-processing protein DprA [Planobispora rosea]GGS85245.1 hypothetical protein GCM10010156_49830 [Planobispora rosea]GIH86494.1 hypothetical protein Pro02_49020 [Planobispora rosea]